MEEHTIVIREPGDLKKPANRFYTLDEAIDASKVGKYQAILIAFTGLSALGGLIENLNIGVVLPYAKCELDISTTEQGLLTSMSFLGIFVTIYLWGFMADTYGRQKVLRLCALGGFIFAFLSVFTYNVMLLIVLRFFAGAFLAGTQSVSFTYIAEFHSSRKAARAGAFVSIFIPGIWLALSVPSMLIIPMDWVLWIGPFPFKPWRLLLLCFTSVNLLNAIVFSYLPETPKFLVANQRTDEALSILRRIYAFNTGESEEMYPVTSIVHETTSNKARPTKGVCNILRSIWTQTKPIFREPLSHNTWKMSFVLFLMLAVGHGNFMWFPDFMVQVQNYHGEPTILCNIIGENPSTNVTISSCDSIDNKNITSFQVMSGIAVCFIAISSLCSYYMKKINFKIIVAIWLTFASTASVALTLLSGFYAIVISYVLLLSILVCFNLQTAYTVTLYPVNCRAVATSFILMCGRLGSVVGGNFIGLMLNYECNGIFYAFAGSLATCLVTFMFVKNRLK